MLVEGGSGRWLPFIEGTVGTWGHSPVVATVHRPMGIILGQRCVVVLGGHHCVVVWCFVVMSHQLLHGQLLSSRIAWSSIMVVVCYQFDDDE